MGNAVRAAFLRSVTHELDNCTIEEAVRLCLHDCGVADVGRELQLGSAGGGEANGQQR